MALSWSCTRVRRDGKGTPPHQPPGAADDVAFLDELIRAEEDHTDIVLFEVEHHAHHVSGELEQLAGHGLLQSPGACDSVAHLKHLADRRHLELRLVLLELLPQNRTDLFGLECHGRLPQFRSP